MKAVLKYLVSCFVLVFYLQAAFELNNESVSNTWGDEYDTYIHADKTSDSPAFKTDHGTLLSVATPVLPTALVTLKDIDPAFSSFKRIDHSPPPKLYLSYCAILI